MTGKRRTHALGLLTVVFTVAQAFATPLPPGGVVVPELTNSPAGAVHVAGMKSPFVAVDGVSFSGVLASDVWTGDARNPFGAKGLTFTFRLTNDGPDSLQRLTAVHYGPWFTDVAVNTGLDGGAVPVSVDRGLNGVAVGFDYSLGPGIPAGGNALCW